MIKFLKKVSLFFFFVAVIDVSCGYGFNVLKRNAKGGDTRKNYYIAEECCDDILILGSSRAARHYIPSVLEDSLGMSCYNCGEPGCGIITAYARYKMIAKRHKPRLVIYEVSPIYDYFSFETDDYSKYLGRVRQYADKPVVKELYLKFGDKLEGVRLLSNMYKNNSFIVHNIVDLLGNDKGKGFKPLYGVLSNDARPQYEPFEQRKIDKLKYSYMEKLIIDIKKDSIPFCFMVSPRFIMQKEALSQKSEYKPIIELCSRYEIPFFDYTYIEGFSDNYQLFQDFGHLNVKGATVFSNIVCNKLNKVLIQ